MKHLDRTRKEKGKDYGDNRRKAKHSKIDVGDHVVLKNVIKRNKLTTNFNPQPFLVVKKSGTRITVKNLSSGVEMDRHVNHAKCLISCNPFRSVSLEESSPAEDQSTSNHEPERNPTSRTAEGVSQESSSSPIRSKREKRKPDYLNDYFIYKCLRLS